MIVVCIGVITSENDNKWLDSGYILKVEPKLFVNELDAKRWVWETEGSQELH